MKKIKVRISEEPGEGLEDQPTIMVRTEIQNWPGTRHEGVVVVNHPIKGNKTFEEIQFTNRLFFNASLKVARFPSKAMETVTSGRMFLESDKEQIEQFKLSVVDAIKQANKLKNQ